MRKYPKTYEDVFTSDQPKNKNKLNLDEITVYGMELNDYTSLFKDFLTDFYNDLFLRCVQLSWLRRKFTYYGKKTILPMYRNPRGLNMSFVKLLRRNVGKDIQIITKSKFFTKLETYFDELFPDFDDWNPFTNPDHFKFPYENISIDFLFLVHQLDDRMDLLEEAERNDMTFAQFLDYVINHVYCENDILGRQRYQIKHNIDRTYPYYVKDVDKKLKAKKGRKRP